MVSSTNTASAINLQSPNAIPPRTSSTGYTTPQPLPPVKSVLRPVPESDWLGQGNRHRKNSSASRLPLTGMNATAAQDPARYASEDLNFTSRKTWTEQKEKVLMGPYEYLFAHPGKDLRTLMVNSFNAWLHVPQESLDVITKVVGMLHTASLLVDDVEDNSVLRRGLPVTHSIFGTAQTINSANYVYFCALQELQTLKNPKAVSVYTEELLNLHRGQGMDLFWRDTLTCPTEEEYLEMVGNKCGGLFRLAIKLMQAESNSRIDCVPLVNLLGIIFQIQDDYRNLSSPEYGENKGLCEDLTEGKFSFLIIHSIRSNPANLQLLNILKQKTSDDEVKRYAVKYMEGTGSFDYTKKVVDVLVERARKMADDIDDGRGKNVGIHKILDKMVV
ncbi:Uu.00g100810.m01.CDS01 [Anthostomella pinea]|uniref:Uu.00g100810.m01.CDS01 n=1 Tax=Anthostomella pinea TaxID=933095 RepID=A0AAI8VD45_9PEZI|nr:Uu.00g100810.m01.CDS01 [Anthostomella pinea]